MPRLETVLMLVAVYTCPMFQTHICMYVCVCVYLYIYIYIYIYIPRVEHARIPLGGPLDYLRRLPVPLPVLSFGED